MLIRLRQILWTTPLLVALAAAPGLEAQTEAWIKGRVAATDGQPIAGVTVVLTSPGAPDFRKETASNKKGKFQFVVADASLPYEATFTQAGYKPLLVKVQPTPGGTTSVDAVLAKAGERPPGEPEGEAGRGPNPAAVAYQQGMDALTSNDFDAAVEKLNEAARLAPKVAAVHSSLAQAYLDKGDDAAAAASAEQALELDPSDTLALLVRYQAYRGLGDDERAAQALAALKGSQGAEVSAKRIFNEGVKAYSAGDMVTAKARFLVAVELDPKLPEAYLALAEIYRLDGNLEQSLAMADKVLELEPGDVRALRSRFLALLNLQRTDDLRATLDQLVAADPEWATAHLPELARSAFNDDLMAAAAVLYQKLVEVNPADAKAHYTLGLCYYNLGESTLAKSALTRFLELAPDDPDAAAARSMLKYLG